MLVLRFLQLSLLQNFDFLGRACRMMEVFRRFGKRITYHLNHIKKIIKCICDSLNAAIL